MGLHISNKLMKLTLSRIMIGPTLAILPTPRVVRTIGNVRSNRRPPLPLLKAERRIILAKDSIITKLQTATRRKKTPINSSSYTDTNKTQKAASHYRRLIIRS